jgi:hypothetical protein
MAIPLEEALLNPHFLRKVSEFGLSAALLRILNETAQIEYVLELAVSTKAEMLGSPNCGRAKVRQFEDAILTPLGFSWGTELEGSVVIAGKKFQSWELRDAIEAKIADGLPDQFAHLLPPCLREDKPENNRATYQAMRELCAKAGHLVADGKSLPPVFPPRALQAMRSALDKAYKLEV